jgi:hypothetical protein
MSVPRSAVQVGSGVSGGTVAFSIGSSAKLPALPPSACRLGELSVSARPGAGLALRPTGFEPISAMRTRAARNNGEIGVRREAARSLVGNQHGDKA